MKENIENKIDDFFLKGLDNLNVIPPAGVWDDIAKNIQPKKKRGMIIWIAVAASVTLFATVSGWFYLQTNSSGKIDNSVQIIAKSDNQKTSETLVIKGNSDIQVSEQDKNKARLVDSKTFEGSFDKTKLSDKYPETINKYDISTQDKVAKNNIEPTNTNPAENQLSGIGHVTKSPKVQNGNSYGQDNQIDQKETVNSLYEKGSAIASIQFHKFDAPDIYGSVHNITPIVKVDSLPVYDQLFASIDETDSKSGLNRWAIGGQLAPLYSYRNISQVNDPGLNKSSMDDLEKAVITYASGVMIDYEATSRLTFQTGIYYMKMGQEINNVSSFTKKTASMDYMAMSANRNEAIVPVVTNSTGIIMAASDNLYVGGSVNSDNQGYAPGNLAVQPANDNFKKNIVQSFEFLEVPFIAKYKIIDRKIDVNLLGGLSTHVLMNNKATVVFADNTTAYGITTDVETFNYSSSMGFGVVYSLKKNLTISVEPTFKYYLNSFNSSDVVKLHPYAFGIYSGISFKF